MKKINVLCVNIMYHYITILVFIICLKFQWGSESEIPLG